MGYEESQNSIKNFRWILYGLISSVLYLSGFSFGLFLLPLQMFFEKKQLKENRYLTYLVVIVVVAWRSFGALNNPVILITLLEFFGMLSMLIALEWYQPKSQDLVFSLMYGLGFVFSAPLVGLISQNHEIRQMVGQVFQDFFPSLLDSEREEILSVMISIMQRSFGLGVFLTASFVLFVGKMLGSKTFRDQWRISLADFELGSIYLWVLILSWAVALMDTQFPLGIFGMLSWNIALGTGVMYGLQGLAILQAWFNGKQRPKSSPIGLLLFLLLVPGINGVVAIGLPLLGISENWIRYQSRSKENKS
jgi:hypothetical protein